MTATTERHGVITEAGTIVFERLLPGPIERVWEFLTDSEKRGRWLATGPMDEHVGGKVELFFRHKDLSTIHEQTPERYKSIEDGVTLRCEVTACRMPHLLSYLWGNDGSEVTFELMPEGKQVRLTLTHRRLPDRKESISVASGWHTHLGLLVDQLNDERPRAFWSTFEKFYRDYETRIPE